MVCQSLWFVRICTIYYLCLSSAIYTHLAINYGRPVSMVDMFLITQWDWIGCYFFNTALSVGRPVKVWRL